MTYRVKLCSACPYLNELSAHHDPDAAHYACITCPADDVAPKIVGIYPRRRVQRSRVNEQADALEVSYRTTADNGAERRERVAAAVRRSLGF